MQSCKPLDRKAKVGQPLQSNPYNFHFLSVWLCFMWLNRLRTFYPKTTVPMARECDPVCFRSVTDTYKWAFIFLDRVATCFGSSWVCQRLARWKWNLSTAFSGIGCAETVRVLEFAMLYLTVDSLNLHLISQLWNANLALFHSLSKQNMFLRLHWPWKLLLGSLPATPSNTWSLLQPVKLTKSARMCWQRHSVDASLLMSPSWKRRSAFAKNIRCVRCTHVMKMLVAPSQTLVQWWFNGG